MTGQGKAASLASEAIKGWDLNSTTFHVIVSKGKNGFAVESFPSGPETDSLLLKEVVVANMDSLHG